MATIYFPFGFKPNTGGDFVNVEHIQTLCKLGVDAKVLFIGDNKEEAKQFVDVPVLVNDSPIAFNPDDIIMLSECTPGMFKQAQNQESVVSKLRHILHHQNPFYSGICGQSARDFNDHPLERIIVPSEYAARRLREMGINKPIDVIKPYVPAIFAPKEKLRNPIRIAYSSRKRAAETNILMFYLKSHYHGRHAIELINIIDSPREKVASIMAQSAIFLSFAEREAMGLMALEAMASGCHIVGFSGYSGGYNEYMNEQNGDWIAEGDYLGFTQKLIEAIDLFASGAPDPKVEAGLATVAQHFRQHHFEHQLKLIYSDILNRDL